MSYFAFHWPLEATLMAVLLSWPMVTKLTILNLAEFCILMWDLMLLESSLARAVLSAGSYTLSASSASNTSLMMFLAFAAGNGLSGSNLYVFSSATLALELSIPGVIMNTLLEVEADSRLFCTDTDMVARGGDQLDYVGFVAAKSGSLTYSEIILQQN